MTLILRGSSARETKRIKRAKSTRAQLSTIRCRRIGVAGAKSQADTWVSLSRPRRPSGEGFEGMPAVPDPLRHLPTVLFLLAIVTALVAAVGFWLEIGGLIQLGLIWLFVSLLVLYGHTWQRLQRQREVRENMRQILAERNKD